jgi:hypothetical protein
MSFGKYYVMAKYPVKNRIFFVANLSTLPKNVFWSIIKVENKP